jgi:hypothetical protein
MRLILLLASILVIGLLVARQIGPSPERQSGVAEDEGLKVPAAPSDLDWFADDMNRSVEESAQQRREAIEAQTR